MSFSTKGIVVTEKSGVSKYLSYGVQQAAITGFELKTAKTGKQQVYLLMESPKVQDAGFEPDEKAKFGGKVGKVQFTIYFDNSSESQMKEFIENVALIAKKLGVSEKVDTIEASSIEEYMNKLLPVIRGKFAWWAITAEEYIYNKDGEDKVGYGLKFRRYGFVASLDDMAADPNHIKAFDKSNIYDYKPALLPSKDPDAEDPIMKAFGPGEELPWD